MMTSTQYQEKTITEEQTGSVHDLVVFNDDINTFEHVIDTLVDVCEHSPEQAEQCTIIIHHTGKCSVKEGPIRKNCTKMYEEKGNITRIRKCNNPEYKGAGNGRQRIFIKLKGLPPLKLLIVHIKFF